MKVSVLPAVLATAACLLGATVLVSACGGSTEATSTTTTAVPTTSSGSSTTSVSLSGDEAAIAANYVKFFDGTQPVADKIGLLENGQQYTKELETQGASPLAKMASVSVSSVTITSPTAAEVKYSILVGGQPALPDQIGEAVLQGGVWKVGIDSFMALLALQQGSTTPSS